MFDLSTIEDYYKKFKKNLRGSFHESIVQVDISLLNELNLLMGTNLKESHLTRYFRVIETTDKMTLINEEFIIWIIPEKTNNINSTTILINLNKSSQPVPELALLASGVYNSSKLILHLLEIVLEEIHESEELISFYKSNQI